MYRVGNIDIPPVQGSSVAIHMDLAQVFAENPFIIVSVLSGSAAAAVLLYAILRSKRRVGLFSSAAEQNEPESSRWNGGSRRSVLDRITLLNRNLAQCPRCYRIEFANARFCSGCGTSMIDSAESLMPSPHELETHYATQNGPTRLVGISMKPDARTKIGVIISLQEDDSQTKIKHAQKS